MKFEVGRALIRIVAESEQDVAYFEDTLGLRQDGDFINLCRQDYAANEYPSLETSIAKARVTEIPEEVEEDE